jgi:hypothetical protein
MVVFLNFRKEIQHYYRANISGVNENSAIYSYSGTSGVLDNRYLKRSSVQFCCGVWCLFQKHETLIRTSITKRREAIVFIKSVKHGT